MTLTVLNTKSDKKEMIKNVEALVDDTKQNPEVVLVLCNLNEKN